MAPIMILARRLILLMTAVILPVIGIEGWRDFQEDVAQYQLSTERELTSLASGFGVAFGLAWRKLGQPEALQLIRLTEEKNKEVEIRWVWLDETSPSPTHPRATPEQVRALESTHGHLVLSDPNGGDRMVVYQSVDTGESRPGALELSQSFASMRAFRKERLIDVATETTVILVFCASIVLTLGVLFVGRPIRTLTSMARQVGSGDFSGRLSVRRTDELAILAEEMNVMCERLEAKDREIQG